MRHGASCEDVPIRIADIERDPVRWGDERGYEWWDRSTRCGDCGVGRGGVHHHGCDLEQCPACDGQLISCGCLDEVATEHSTEHTKGGSSGR
jgi:hypothetical protein